MEMIKPLVNPWARMEASSSRRVDIQTKHNLFWIKDVQNRYGLLIELSMGNIELFLKLKGVAIVIQAHNDVNNIYILLNDNADWQIFLAVCSDLISAIYSCEKKERIAPILNQRLSRWQKLLSKNNSVSLSEIRQMGLFSELYCLKESIIPRFGIERSIMSWVGPNSDKKDFSLPDFFIEVKSYISSKGATVKISSLEQLDADIKPIYLATYGLTKTANTISVIDLVNSIAALIQTGDNQTKDAFEDKLAFYGYINGVTEPPFYNYLVDIKRYYLVTDDFPRLSKSSIDTRITGVEYNVDLTRCVSNQTQLPI
jgi:hypothetical protein